MDPDLSWNAILRPGLGEPYFTVDPLPAFEAGRADFSPVNAYWLSELSRLIYRPDIDELGEKAPVPTRAEILGRVGLEEQTRIGRGTNYGTVVGTPPEAAGGFAALVFRGTSGFEGWFSNLKVLQTEWPGGGSVHAGFFQDFTTLWEGLADHADGIELPLYFTGHSLGGALAVLAAAARPATATYTFGAPRVGDPAFTRTLRGTPIHRVVNGRDVVPTVPPSRIPFHFTHGIPAVEVHDDDPPDPSPSGRRLAGPPDFLSDHAPINYVAHLARRLTRNSRMPAGHDNGLARSSHAKA